MLDTKRYWFEKIEKSVGKFFSSFSLQPNDYTLLSLFFAFFSFYFLTKRNLFLSLFFFLFASFLDFIDGAVARNKNLTTKKGAYLDTICDRYVEGFLILGILFLPLPEILFPHYFWLFLILFGAMMTTYAKASAKEKDLTFQELKGGILSRGERVILLVLSLILGIFSFVLMTYLLIFIALLTNITALQRVKSALSKNL
ncbi:MAG: CDP-alcohol phosphatidyltransferase family protein [Minisyncoccales bacterium]